jgi:hypothetical protein
MKNKIINWLFEKIVIKIDNAGLYADRENTISKLIDLEKRLGSKINYEEMLTVKEVVSAILDHLEVRVGHEMAEDERFDKPKPRMIEKTILVPVKKT